MPIHLLSASGTALSGTLIGQPNTNSPNKAATCTAQTDFKCPLSTHNEVQLTFLVTSCESFYQLIIILQYYKTGFFNKT